MTYSEELMSRLGDVDQWPDFDRPEFLDELDMIADESFSKNTIEGYLAALLIYQQIAEEIIRLYLKDHEFFIQLSVFPAQITFSEKRKTMFGRIVEELKSTITLEESKEIIISKANRLNSLRIEVVHGLTRLQSIEVVKNTVTEAKLLYEELHQEFDNAHDEFRLAFHSFKKDSYIDYFEEA